MTDTPRKFRPALTGKPPSQRPGPPAYRAPRSRPGRRNGQPRPPGPIPLTWQRGRVHELARMKLIDLIALYQSMLPTDRRA